MILLDLIYVDFVQNKLYFIFLCIYSKVHSICTIVKSVQQYVDIFLNKTYNIYSLCYMIQTLSYLIDIVLRRNIYMKRSCKGPGHDRMVVGLTTTYAIGAYHH